MRLYPLYLIAISLCIGCGSTDPISSVPEDSGNTGSGSDEQPSAPEEVVVYDNVIDIDCTDIINSGYIGNGVQWDPYEMYNISDADWEKIYARLDFMKPQFIRMMHNVSGKAADGVLNPETGHDHLSHLLDYCQSRGITVMFGDWGGRLLDTSGGTINESLLRNEAEYVDFLVNRKGYDCIKYFNLVNEPNGNWSQAKGNYQLWSQATRFFWEEMKKLDLDGKVGIAAPDVAVWTDAETNWITASTRDLSDAIGVYDIHTYPSKHTVNSGEYTDMIKAYKEVVPQGHKIVMGEIGFKYIDPEDTEYQEENLRRAEALPHASLEDSQMFVYDYMYGTDMADALFQTINAGYSGCVAWMLDDAMHYKEPGKLKIWGFWNIFGDEYYGAEHEKVRPWFYAWSLLCKYLPEGSDFYLTEVSGEDGIKAVSSVCNGKRTIAIVNVTDEVRTVKITAEGFEDMKKAVRYVYGEGLFSTSGDCIIHPASTDMTFSPASEETLTLDPESLVVISEL